MNKLPTVDIKGKDYVMVKDRVLYFNETYKNGVIQTKLFSSLDSERIVIRAVAIPDMENPGRYFTGHASETIGNGHINASAALENAETSAVGRALGMMGIGVVDSIASGDEVNKAVNAQQAPSKPVFGTKVEAGSMCPKHGVPFIKFEKNGRSWYSHKDGDAWCNKPKELQVEEDFDDFPDEEL